MRRGFTILEVLISLAILALVGSVVGVQIIGLIQKSRFDKEMTGLSSALQEAQFFSSTYRTDIQFDLFEEKGEFYFQLSTDEPLSEALLSQKKHPLSLVKKVLQNGALQKKIRLTLYAGGRMSPPCILTFFSSFDPKEENGIYLDITRAYLIKLSRETPVGYRDMKKRNNYEIN